jgi:sarcosine oxidase, subunit gamma
MRTSPIYDSLRRLDPAWSELNGMAIARNLATRASTALQLCDLSALRRTGLKGPGAASWLQARNLHVPEHANSWSALDSGGLVARLGRNEFMLEDGPHGAVVSGVVGDLAAPPVNVYPVLRQDAALIMRGEAVHELLTQTCSIDFSSIPTRDQVVTLTMLAGIAVTVIDDSAAHPLPCFRLWCDGTYGIYLWETLLEIAGELGGGAVGFAAIYPDLQARSNEESNKS